MRRALSCLLLFAAFAVLLVTLHLPLLGLPYHWDELGQFVPAARDLYEDGAWVARSTLPNIHPPGVMAAVALGWKVLGYSIRSARITMLLVAAAGALFSFLLAIRLARGVAGAPAFVAVALLLAAPMFYTQSLMVLLDLPAMALTALALLLFLNQRYTACAVACVALVLTKETAVTTPLVFAAWLWFADRRRREASYFLAPLAALGGWLVVLHDATGSWSGNPEFARYNIADSLAPGHVLYAIARRAYTLLFADGHWIGAIALRSAWRAGMFRGRDWKIAGSAAAAQLAAVTLFGGAVLDRYLLPVLPVLYAAFAAGLTVFSRRRRIAAIAAMLALLIAGWFIHPPYPFPLENNLAVVDFVYLQRDAAHYLESFYPEARIASVWPFLDAVRNPDFGYVQRRLNAVQAPGLTRDDFARMDLSGIDALVVYTRGGTPPAWLRRFVDLPAEASSAELRTLGFESKARWVRGGQWIEIHTRAGAGVQ